MAVCPECNFRQEYAESRYSESARMRAYASKGGHKSVSGHEARVGKRWESEELEDSEE